MTEDQARDELVRDVSRETQRRLEVFASFLEQEALDQNLVAHSTLASIWSRHFLDSAQLLRLAPPSGPWIDIGSGAGLPGLVIAALTERSVILIEPRVKRCDFLMRAATLMGVQDHVRVIRAKAETAPTMDAGVISARAVASLSHLFGIGLRFANSDTVWLLPKGRSAHEEVAATRASWHAHMELVPSITDPEAAIVVASGVTPRKRT